MDLSREELEYIQTSASVSDVQKSQEINELATALAKVQGQLGAAKKDSSGYGYNYSDLATVIETSKEELSKNGLSVTQLLGSDGQDITVTTLLLHSSGQYLGSKVSAPPVDMKGVNEVQKRGASISYMRRYALQAILNMASEDNDASSKGFDKKSSGGSSKPSGPQKFRRPESSKGDQSSPKGRSSKHDI